MTSDCWWLKMEFYFTIYWNAVATIVCVFVYLCDFTHRNPFRVDWTISQHCCNVKLCLHYKKNGLVHYLIATNKRTTIEKKRVAFICHCTTIVNGDVHLRGNGSREKVDWSLKWWPNHDETAILSCFPFSFSF